MKLVLDNIVFDLQQSGGISVVWYELLRSLQNKHYNVRYIDNHAVENLYRRLLDIKDADIIGTDYCVALSRYLPVWRNIQEPFLFHSSYYRYCASPQAINITTVHDFTYERYRCGLRKTVHSWQKKCAVSHSDYVVCVSENTKRDLLDFIPGLDEKRVRVVYNGVSDDYRVLEKKPQSNILPFDVGTYVVYVGDRSEYKNFPLCVKALKHTALNLVIVGRTLQAAEKDFVLQHLPASRFKDIGYISNERLNVLYNYAAALVYPSVYEGFGIPVVEAQKAGCPVIAFNGSSIPEVAGSDVLLMNELSVDALIEKLQLLDRADLMTQVRHDGLLHSSLFSWEQMARQYFDIYEEAYSKKMNNVNGKQR